MEPLLHFVILFTALIILGIKFRKAFTASLIALIPDLDVLFHVHRSISHSAIPAIIVSLLLLYTFKKHRRLIVLALIAYLSHLFLDIFCGYTPILYPIYGKNIWISVELNSHISSFIGLGLNFKILTKPVEFKVFESLDALLFTSEGVASSIILLSSILISKLTKWLHKPSLKPFRKD